MVFIFGGVVRQLCYVSYAKSVQPQLLEDLREILSEARNFNHEHDVHGVLYFADGQFFQCLEGDERIIVSLVEKLKKDQRHHQCKFFDLKVIEQPLFSDWSMKYVSRHSEIQKFFAEQGFEKFDPIQLTQKQMDQLLLLLKKLKSKEAELL